jgi:hypothetical protein
MCSTACELAEVFQKHGLKGTVTISGIELLGHSPHISGTAKGNNSLCGCSGIAL